MISKPLSNPWQWLRESIGWTVSCVSGCVVLMMVGVLLVGLLDAPNPELWLSICLAGAVAAHLLVWWKAVDTSWWRQATPQDDLWGLVLAKLWLMLLLVLQVGSLLVLLSLAGLLWGDDHGSNWGNLTG